MATPKNEVIGRGAALAVLGAITCLAVLMRYPPDLNASGRDTFFVAGFAESILVHTHIGWIVHPLSLFGLVPASVPTGGPIVFAGLSAIASIPVGASIVLSGLALTVLSVSAGFLLGHSLIRSNFAALACSAAFGVAPRLVVFTAASGSTRSFVLALFPVVLFLVVRATRARWHRRSLLVFAFGTLGLMALFHRSFLLGLFVAPAFALSYAPWRRIRLAFVRPLRVPAYVACLIGAIGLTLTGTISQLATRESDYSSGAVFQGTTLAVHLGNLSVDYASSLGAMAAFVPLGVFALLRDRRWSFPQRFVLALLLVYGAVLGVGQYTILVVLPILAVVAVLGFVLVSRRWFNRASVAAILLAAVFVSTAISASYMTARWQEAEGSGVFVDPGVFAASEYMRVTDPHGFFVSNDWSSTGYKAWGLSGNPPIGWDLAIPLSEGVISASDLDLQFRPSISGLYVVNSGLLERTHWVELMTSDPRSPTAQYVIALYNLTYFLEKRPYANSPTTNVFINAIHDSEYPVFESPQYTIWIVPRL